MKRMPMRKFGLVDDHSSGKATLGSCMELVMSQMPALMGNVLDGLQIAAGLHAFKKPQGATLRPELVTIIRHLGASREPLCNAFAGQIRVLAYGGLADGPDKPLVRFEDIQLLDMHQLDESIELARVQQELIFVVEPVLPRLNALMSALMGWITVQPAINPLRPEFFAKALRDAVAVFVPSREHRGELLGIAAGRLGVGLRQIYRELSEWLQSTGVEPAGLTPAVATAETAKTPERLSETARTLLTLDRLRRLFSADLAAMGSLTGGVDFLHTVPASIQALQDMKQVEAMIQRLELRKRQKSAEAGDAAAQQVDSMRRAGSEGRWLGRQIGQEVTRMVLDNLTLDERLLPRVRALLEELGPTLMELSESDARFFSDARHPARQFLERVTDRSLAFATDSEPGFDRFVRDVGRAIQTLAASAAEERSQHFALELERLQQQWERDDRTQTKLREETARRLLHIEQRNLLAERLVHEWRPSLLEEAIPRPVVEFVSGPWAQAVAEAQLNPSVGVDEQHRLTHVVDDLLWSVQPARSRKNPARLVQIIPGVLSTLRAGLQMINYPPDLITRFFDQLIGWHEEVLQEIRPAREAAGAAAEESVVSATVPPSESAAISSAEDLAQGVSVTEDFAETPWLAEDETDGAGYLEADSVLPLDLAHTGQPEPTAAPVPEGNGLIGDGAWVELMLDGKWERLQLSWISPHRTLFMFTALRGTAHSMSRRTMNRLLAKGMIRIISSGQIVDQALDDVAQQALLNSLSRLPDAE